MIRTGWFSPGAQPKREGVYEVVAVKNGELVVRYAEWWGHAWSGSFETPWQVYHYGNAQGAGNPIWRGLAKRHRSC